ncbi:MAG: MFS transporter [Holosporales bacterium]|jgi:PAT family beta-lactamase induction signal transducer AmpG|nr:MFS transporter [Holosporales bacterium]
MCYGKNEKKLLSNGNFFKQNSKVLLFLFLSYTTCGIVFFGVMSGFGFMLAEKGLSPSSISTIFIATLPYSFKFAISPFIKNIITKINIKMFTILIQIIVIINIILLGTNTEQSPIYLIFINVFILTLASSVNDIIADYIRLVSFEGKTLGTALSVGTIGFRFGMFISGAGILYIASFYNWTIAFSSVSIFILINILATIMLPPHKNLVILEKNEINSIKNYLNFCKGLFKKYNITAILLLTLSFKFTDSCINTLKSVFFQEKGLSKIDYANISQIMGVVVTIIVGMLAATFTYKMNIKKCSKIAFFGQIIASICFIILSSMNCTFMVTTIFVNISTFFLGFSTIIYRTYISEISARDINVYTIFISLGSIGRIICSYIGGIIVDTYSWHTLYFLCALSNILGFFICFYSNIQEKKKIF